MNLLDLVDLVAARTGGTAKKAGGGYVVRCPAHEDKRASLSICEGDKGLLLKCHAGCDVKSIAGALGLKLADLFHDKAAPSSRPARPVKAAAKATPAPARRPLATGPTEKARIVATYDYTDAMGKLIYQVVRMDPKDFRQRRPDKAKPGGWNWSLGDTRRVLFRLTAVRREAAGGGAVFVCEGEKDVLTLESLGFVATCNAGGAGKWLAEYTASLKGAARVVIVADKDEPGRKHAVKVASEVAAEVKDVRVIECPDVAGKAVKDASDYFAAGGTREQFVAIVESAKPFAVVSTEAGPIISGEKPPELPPAVYEPARGCFYVPTPDGEWMKIPEASLMVRIRRAGFRMYLKDANGVTETEHAKERIMDERNVAYAGRIAGYAPGLRTICGTRMLVTSGPTLIQPKAGEWADIEAMMQQWFGNDPEHGARQFWTLFGWLGAAYRSLVTGMATGQFGPGQALFLVGEGGVGKSVFQTFVTRLLGGRVADPSRFLSGNEFTKDIIAAEHNAIEDTATARDIDSRRQFGQALKNLVVNQTHSLHGKGADAITVSRFCRVTVSLNGQPQDLMVLPELSGGVVDKTIIVKVGKAKLPDLLDTRAVADFWGRIMAQLPAFIHALQTTKLPEIVTGCETARRYGVASWQHPEVVNLVEDLSPWRRLLELIDFCKPWADGMEPDAIVRAEWTGTTADLEALLMARAKERAMRQIRGPLYTGRDLRGISEARPNRIESYAAMGHTKWRIFNPERGV